MDDALARTFKWMDELYTELQLPGVSRGTFMRRPALILGGKSIVGSKDGRALVAHCPLEIKDLLLETEPNTYFETDHYKGYPAILMRPDKLSKDVLRARIEAAWRMNASKRQLGEYQARGSS